MSRDEFSQEVKRVLCDRAGNRCSFPMCNKLTTGPSNEDPNKVSRIGVAAHITAASKGGPRYDGGLTPDFRKSVENGIWLCQDHAKIIDTDVSQYTTEKLKKWKVDHERKISLELSGLRVRKGAIVSITVKNLARIKGEQTVRFSDRTIILGKNGSGKTLICEFITALTGSSNIERWLRSKGRQGNSNVRLEVFDGEFREVNFNIKEDRLTCTIDGKHIPYIKLPLNVLHIDKRLLVDDDFDFVESLSRFFGLDTINVINIIELMGSRKKHFIDDVVVEHQVDDAGFATKKVVKIKPFTHKNYLEYVYLSGSERQSFIIEFALACAGFLSESMPTILIMEQTAFATLYDDRVEHLLTVLEGMKTNFQLILTFGHEYKFSSFKVWELVETEDRESFYLNER